MVDHRHLADKGDIVKMAKVWVDARDYLFILVSQSLHTKLGSKFNKSEKYGCYNQMFREADTLLDTESITTTRKGRKISGKIRHIHVVNINKKH